MQRPHPQRTAEPIDAPWGSLIADEQWNRFVDATAAIRAAGVQPLLGGALALATYTRRWQNTKDVDVIVPPSQRDAAIRAVTASGFGDYFASEAYDRSWIFRAVKDQLIYDIIWDLPNHRVEVDAEWFERAVPVRLRGDVFQAVPPEELVRIKLYVMQEVFARNRHFLEYSRDRLRDLWRAAA